MSHAKMNVTDWRQSKIERSNLELLDADGSKHTMRLPPGDLFFEIREAFEEGKELGK